MDGLWVWSERRFESNYYMEGHSEEDNLKRHKRLCKDRGLNGKYWKDADYFTYFKKNVEITVRNVTV